MTENENFQADPDREISRLRSALIEIDTYLANDPDVWRIGSVAKVGDVLCDVLGAETIQGINASVKANLCARCADDLVVEGPITGGKRPRFTHHAGGVVAKPERDRFSADG